jgi:hypothetical protein
MNAAWFNERAVVICVSVAELMKRQDSSVELDQILLDALRIYSSTYAVATLSLEAALMELDRSPGDENIELVKKAMSRIKANPDEVASVLENFATL